jgi:hypothetical protein
MYGRSSRKVIVELTLSCDQHRVQCALLNKRACVSLIGALSDLLTIEALHYKDFCTD